jgi:hypothetical protein
MCVEHQTGVDFIGAFLIADIFISFMDFKRLQNDDNVTRYFKWVYMASKFPIIFAIVFYCRYWIKDTVNSRKRLPTACCTVVVG